MLSKIAAFKLKKFKFEFAMVFNKYQFKYLFGKEIPMYGKLFVKLINRDLGYN